MKSCKCAGGFTLVELAIVITIIGILIGGVLKGQQLIDQARIAATIQQMSAYKSALQIFQTSYDAMPGDIKNAENRIMNCTGCTATAFPHSASSGDGIVGGRNDVRWTHEQNVLGSENTLFWTHLYKAEMITGISDAALNGGPIAWGQTHPAAKMGGGFSVGNVEEESSSSWSGGRGPNGMVIILHKNVNGDTGVNTSNGIMSIAEGASIDRKLDDGQPDSGDVRGVGGGAACGDTSAAPAAVYNEATAGDSICNIAYVLD